MLSCPLKDPIVITCSITSKPIDQCCILEGKKDHPYLTCTSYMAWHFAARRSIKTYEKYLADGNLAIQEKMPESSMQKIYAGANASANFPTGFKKVLREQGFIVEAD
jgi:hypothetical protein